MYRIDNATAITPLPAPSAPGVNPNYYFTKGNPGLSIPATILDDEWANMVQEEVCNAVTGAGLALSKATRNQLFLAIQAIAQSGLGLPTDTGAANALVVALTPVLAARVTGQVIKFKVGAGHTNTGPCTLNAGPGAVSLKTVFGSNPWPGMIKAGSTYEVIDDGTNYVVVGFSERLFTTSGSGVGFNSFGIVELGSGFIMQWGILGGGTGGTPATFPTAFPTTMHAIWGTAYESTVGVASIFANAYPVSNTQYEANASNMSYAVIWFAIGN